VSQEEQAIALLTDDQALAWLTPAGAERVVDNGFKSIPLVDPHIRLDIHLVNRCTAAEKIVRKIEAVAIAFVVPQTIGLSTGRSP
jgi:hypothetical protein